MISSVTQTRSGKLVAGMAEVVTGEVDCGRAAAEVAKRCTDTRSELDVSRTSTSRYKQGLNVAILRDQKPLLI